MNVKISSSINSLKELLVKQYSHSLLSITFIVYDGLSSKKEGRVKSYGNVLVVPIYKQVAVDVQLSQTHISSGNVPVVEFNVTICAILTISVYVTIFS
jgi:hypothetical protein